MNGEPTRTIRRHSLRCSVRKKARSQKRIVAVIRYFFSPRCSGNLATPKCRDPGRATTPTPGSMRSVVKCVKLKHDFGSSKANSAARSIGKNSANRNCYKSRQTGKSRSNSGLARQFMRITLFGAAGGEVTGSAYFVQANSSSLLVDFGMFQGTKQAEQLNVVPRELPVNGLNCVVLTHAHLDHTGRLPLLVQQKFGAPIFATPA